MRVKPVARVVGTDGSCLRNPDGPTGWAYVGQDGSYALGGRPAGTNQIGELLAILTVLTDQPAGELEIQSDSAYAIGCSSTWKPGWQRAGYVRKTGPIANLDLIIAIHQLLDSRADPVRFVKVKAHLSDVSVHPLNVRADELAGHGARAAQRSGRPVSERGIWPWAANFDERQVRADRDNSDAVISAGGQRAPSRAEQLDRPERSTGFLF